MDASEAISTFEVVLRDLIRSVIGDDWRTMSGVDIAGLELKRDAERKRRRGVFVSGDLLDYTEFPLLGRMIQARWADFKPALGGTEKKYFDAYFSRLEAFRNPSAHSRTLQPFEEHLVLGITGEYRNLVSIYRSQKGPDLQYYPTVELIEDSFGRRYTMADGNVIAPAIRLHVGQTLEFRCKAQDPEGRDILWEIRPQGAQYEGYQLSGNEVTFSMEVREHYVREQFMVFVLMTSAGKFHRHGDYDEQAVFFYAVDPPRV